MPWDSKKALTPKTEQALEPEPIPKEREGKVSTAAWAGAPHPNKKQYPLREEAFQGIQLTVETFLKCSLIGPCQSLQHNHPANKPPPTNEYGGVQDLQPLTRNWKKSIHSPKSIHAAHHHPRKLQSFHSSWLKRCLLLYSIKKRNLNYCLPLNGEMWKPRPPANTTGQNYLRDLKMPTVFQWNTSQGSARAPPWSGYCFAILWSPALMPNTACPTPSQS